MIFLNNIIKVKILLTKLINHLEYTFKDFNILILNTKAIDTAGN